MKIEAHYNENGDLLVTVSDRTTEMQDQCFGVDKRWMDKGDADNYNENWFDNLKASIEAHAGKGVGSELKDACDSAVASDGIMPKD